MDGAGAFVVIILVCVLYFLPTLVAAGRKKSNIGTVVILNLFLGWTFIGWVVSLAMAFGATKADRPMQTVNVYGERPTAQNVPLFFLSEDGQYWQDGRQWVDTNLRVPPNAQRGPDGKTWWDGSRWRPVPEPLAVSANAVHRPEPPSYSPAGSYDATQSSQTATSDRLSHQREFAPPRVQSSVSSRTSQRTGGIPLSEATFRTQEGPARPEFAQQARNVCPQCASVSVNTTRCPTCGAPLENM